MFVVHEHLLETVSSTKFAFNDNFYTIGATGLEPAFGTTISRARGPFDMHIVLNEIEELSRPLQSAVFDSIQGDTVSAANAGLASHTGNPNTLPVSVFGVGLRGVLAAVLFAGFLGILACYFIRLHMSNATRLLEHTSSPEHGVAWTVLYPARGGYRAHLAGATIVPASICYLLLDRLGRSASTSFSATVVAFGSLYFVSTLRKIRRKTRV